MTNHGSPSSCRSPSGKKDSGSSPPAAARRHSRRPRRSARTSCSWTSSCPTSTASRSCASSANDARVRAVLRRSSGAQPGSGVLAFDDVEIDLERRMVTRDGELVQLSRTEWLLLQHLAANAGKVVLHTELLTKVWGPEYRDDLQYLRVWVSRVRRKLGAVPGEAGRIRTFQGIGYLLDVEGSAGGGQEEGTVESAEASGGLPAEAPQQAR